MDHYLYYEREQVSRALAILGNHNLLMRIAVENHQASTPPFTDLLPMLTKFLQSIPATRLHFEKTALRMEAGQ